MYDIFPFLITKLVNKYFQKVLATGNCVSRKIPHSTASNRI